MKSRINESVYRLLLTGVLLSLSGCSDDAKETTNSDLATTALEIHAVTTSPETRGIVTTASDLDRISVYAQSPRTNTAENSNNHAVYTRTDNGPGSNSWSMDGPAHILLSGEVADVYACSPSGIALDNGATDIQADTTIPISVFTGETIQNTDNTFPVPESGKYAAPAVYSVSKETDYLWATPAKASNGKGKDPQGTSFNINLTMNHALAQISFRFYKDPTYTNAGLLTRMQLNNVNIGTSPKMTIATGRIKAETSQTGTYTRHFGNSGYQLPSFITGIPKKEELNQLPAFSMLVLPDANTDKSSINASFTIDEKVYTIGFSSSDKEWTPGNNCRYTIRLSGTEATVSAIHVQPWGNITDITNEDIH